MVRDSPWVIAGIALSVALIGSTVFLWRRLGARRGLRWLAIGIVPAGLALSGLASMVGRVAVEIGRFFTRFVFSPFVWVGFALLAGAVGLELISRAMRARGVGEPSAAAGQTSGGQVGTKPAQVASGRKQAPPVDDDMADIEALLRKRGIT